MKEITREMMMAAAPRADRGRVDVAVRYLNQWAAKFGIDSDLRMAHFLGQVMHESDCLRAVEENLNYSANGLLRTFPRYFTAATAAQYAYKPAKIANRVYANRMGNGSETSGDGYRFRGRGLLQLTGRDNYKAYADSPNCQGDLMAHPDWLAQFPGAIKSALWYWQKHRLSTLADRDDVVAITRKINGGLNGLDDRKYLVAQFKRVLGV